MHGLETIRKMNNRKTQTPVPGELWRTRDKMTIVFVVDDDAQANIEVVVLVSDKHESGNRFHVWSPNGNYTSAAHDLDLVEYIGTLPNPGEKLGR